MAESSLPRLPLPLEPAVVERRDVAGIEFDDVEIRRHVEVAGHAEGRMARAEQSAVRPPRRAAQDRLAEPLPHGARALPERDREDRESDLTERLGEQGRADRLRLAAAPEVEGVLAKVRRDHPEGQEVPRQVPEVALVVAEADARDDVVEDDREVLGLQPD